MNITFAPNDILQIDDARIIYRNFSGRGDRFNKEGDRNFSLLIPDQETADLLLGNINKYGASWNVKIKPPRDADDAPFIHLPVKVRFNNRGPNIYLKTGDVMNKLDEESVSILDDVTIISVDLDIRPYDDVMPNGTPFRSAYLQSMCVTQQVDRFAERYEID